MGENRTERHSVGSGQVHSGCAGCGGTHDSRCHHLQGSRCCPRHVSSATTPTHKDSALCWLLRAATRATTESCTRRSHTLGSPSVQSRDAVPAPQGLGPLGGRQPQRTSGSEGRATAGSSSGRHVRERGVSPWQGWGAGGSHGRRTPERTLTADGCSRRESSPGDPT